MPAIVRTYMETGTFEGNPYQSSSYSDISYRLKPAAANIGFEEQIYTFPYFCAFLLRRWLAGANF